MAEPAYKDDRIIEGARRPEDADAALHPALSPLPLAGEGSGVRVSLKAFPLEDWIR